MGRRPYSAARSMDKATPAQGSNRSSDLKESQPESAIPIARNEYTPLKQPGSSARQVESSLEISPVMETDDPNPETQQKMSKSKKKKSKPVTTAIRRSMRVQNAIVNASSLEIEPIVEEVTVDDDDDDPAINPDETPPETNLGAMTLEEKLNRALHKLEEQGKIIDMLQTKVNGSSGADEHGTAGNVCYRSMYIESQKGVSEQQKKIEELTIETRHLTQKLDNALGQIEAFEKQGRTMIEALDRMKDTLAISNLIKTIETTVCAAISNATQTALDNVHSLIAAQERVVPAAKRKRDA